MSPAMLRTIIAIVFLAHGVGHSMCVLPALKLVKVEGWSSRSWLLTPLLGDAAARVVAVIIFLTALVGFIVAGLALLGWLVAYDGWRTLALVSAVVSLAGIILYLQAFAQRFNQLGAIVVDVAVLVGLLALNWPSDMDLGLSRDSMPNKTGCRWLAFP